ncbi:pantoate--beta-alanine ligase [Pseudomonas capeferrum]|uniref:pantoate--beta-alanine ligase n=1 Tax=Pseudomonas capeferrum TaxID=1495066 RepID=UPI0015E3B293|nr:pantoate--beta-alanine ligase [Pseudomonas capeferrum]MBA1204414.1 pantoate--beta-alanine ligase [Pseudomonas capeferrum]
MITTDSIQTLRAELQKARDQKKRIGLVPTMGNLHAGHLSLLSIAQRESDYWVTSIFVNPMQFGPQEDFLNYPRTLESDQKALSEAGCSALFAPTVNEMYPEGMINHCSVVPADIACGLCGDYRQGHFEGVATVVAKLFNIVQPDVAVFGQKDYQQLAVIRTLARDLNFTTRVLSGPTLRAQDGLALSSRNGYLAPADRETAAQLYRCICQIADRIKQDDCDVHKIVESGKESLEHSGFCVDYLEVRSANSLATPSRHDKSLVVLVAAYLGATRLIDNLEFDVIAPLSV